MSLCLPNTAFTLAKKSVPARHRLFCQCNKRVYCRAVSCCAGPLYKSELTRHGTAPHGATFFGSVNESELNWAMLVLKTYIWDLCRLSFVQ